MTILLPNKESLCCRKCIDNSLAECWDSSVQMERVHTQEFFQVHRMDALNQLPLIIIHFQVSSVVSFEWSIEVALVVGVSISKRFVELLLWCLLLAEAEASWVSVQYEKDIFSKKTKNKYIRRMCVRMCLRDRSYQTAIARHWQHKDALVYVEGSFHLILSPT